MEVPKRMFLLRLICTSRYSPCIAEGLGHAWPGDAWPPVRRWSLRCRIGSEPWRGCGRTEGRWGEGIGELRELRRGERRREDSIYRIGSCMKGRNVRNKLEVVYHKELFVIQDAYLSFHFVLTKLYTLRMISNFVLCSRRNFVQESVPSK